MSRVPAPTTRTTHLDTYRRLTPRDRLLLSWLAEHYLLSTDQVARALFDSRRTAQQRLTILHRLDVPPLGTAPAPATGLVDIPITGAMSGIMTLAWDAGRGLFWAVSGDGSAIYQLTTAGVATQIFRIGPADRPR